MYVQYISDVHIDLFYDFMIHLDSPKIHVDTIQFNSFMISFQKGFNSRFTKAESSTEGSTHNSTHLWLPTPDSTQYNSTKNKIQLIYDVFNLAKFYW